MKVEMLDNNVLVREIVEKEKVIGGIIVSNPKKYNSVKAEIVSFSPEYSLKYIADEGAIIVIENGKGVATEIDGETYIIIKDSDILAILKQEK